MKTKWTYIQWILVGFVLLGMTSAVSAHQLDDEDSPISFEIEMLSWEKVDKIIPNKTKFTVIDMETGKTFHVQRRAGSKHADVQPLTKKDTKVMKEIYDGKWSWKRRAALVLVNDQLIAGSMHGMPHGAGALQNGFPGHFCIHFSGSTTHRSKNPDFSHELMILKAAGKLDQYINGAGPDEVIEVFAESINQEDKTLLEFMTSKEGRKQLEAAIETIEHISLGDSSVRLVSDEWSVIEIPVRAEVYRKNIGKKRITIRFILRKDGMVDRWIIDSQSLYTEFQ
jgi:hypothetical protein